MNSTEGGSRVEVGEVDPYAGGHRRDRLRPDRQPAEEADVDIDLAAAEQDPAAAAERRFVRAPELELALELPACYLRIDDDHARS